MKIGILGDVHGNIEALKAAYESTVTITVDKTYHLGDLGGYAPFVNEVVDFMIEHGIEGVQGNYDEAVAHEREHCVVNMKIRCRLKWHSSRLNGQKYTLQ